MKRNNLLVSILAILLLVASGSAIYIHIHNKEALDRISSEREFIKMIKDPTLDIDGSSMIGKSFQDFELPDINGVLYKLSSFNSKLKLIVLFDINDCETCLYEYRMWSLIQSQFSREEIIVVGICTNREITIVDNFLRNRGIVFPVLLDPEKKIKNQMHLRVSPLRILLDRNDAVLNIEKTLTTTEHQRRYIEMIRSIVEADDPQT